MADERDRGVARNFWLYPEHLQALTTRAAEEDSSVSRVLRQILDREFDISA